MKLIKLVLALACLSLALPGVAAAEITKGSNYELLAQPQPTESKGKIEVLEFFWYACPHCYHLEPPLMAWLKRKPADVEFRPVPAVLDSSWQQLARTYYAFEAMGLTEKLHGELFNAIHRERALDPRALARDPKPLFDWVAAKGVDRQKFVDTYNSFSVSNRTQRASDLSRSYDVPHTPVLVVDGRYLTSPSMKGNARPDGGADYEKFFANLDELIALVRNQRGATKK